MNTVELETENKKFKDFISVIVRRRWIILLSFLTVTLSTYLYVSRIPDIYESFSTIVIEEKTVIENSLVKSSPHSISYYQGILNSRTFLEMLLDSIGIDLFYSVEPNLSRDKILEYIRNSIELKKTTYSSFLQLTARAKSKELAFFMASTGTRIFQERCRDVESEEQRRATIEIDKQLQLIRKQLEKTEEEYRTFKDKVGNISEGGTTLELTTLQKTYVENLAQLGIKSADLRAEKLQLANLEKKITPSSKKQSPEIVKLKKQLTDLEKEKIRLDNLGIRVSGYSTVDREIREIEEQLLRYSSGKKKKAISPELIRQWQTLRKSVIEKESELALFKKRLYSYKNAIENYKKSNPGILSQSLELIKLKRSKEIYEELYNVILEKAEEQKILNASSGGGVKIVDVAIMPTEPIDKNEERFYIVGILLGLLLGTGIAFLIEFNDTTIKSNEDVEKYLNTAVLGTIPHIVYNKKDSTRKIRRRSSKSTSNYTVTQYPKNLINFFGDESITAEAYRSLRTNLSFVSPDHPLKVLLLTSAGPSEGKSLTISNLALAYAQMGKKTLIVDADLRRPVMHHIFNVKREIGLSDLLAGTASYDDVLKKTESDNFYVVTAGTFTPNPSELIASKKMEKIIEHFRSEFDIVFFDTPPIIAVTDPTILGKKVDGIILVTRSGNTTREIAKRAIQNISNVGLKCLGVILNDINLNDSYSSYGYYKYYYHYYKSKV